MVVEEDTVFELTTRVSSPPSYPTWYVTFIVVQGRFMSSSVGVWHSPFVASSTVERTSLFVSLSFVVMVRYDTSHPFLEGTFIYQICLVTVDWLILWLSSPLTLSPRLTFVYYVYCSCHTLFWSEEESTIIVLYEHHSLVIQYAQQHNNELHHLWRFCVSELESCFCHCCGLAVEDALVYVIPHVNYFFQLVFRYTWSGHSWAISSK